MGLEPQAVKTEQDADVVVGIASGQSVEASQGTAAATAAAWPVKVVDGTDVADVSTIGSAAKTKGLTAVVAKATASTESVDEGDARHLSTDLAGNLRVTLSSGSVDTELPNAAALADGAANPTTPTVGAGALLFNGSTWDRMRGDTTNGLKVDVSRVSGNVATVPGGPTTPTMEYDSGSSIAANGGTDTLDSASITSGTKKLHKVRFASTAQCQADLVKVSNGVEGAVIATLVTSNSHPVDELLLPHPDFCTLANTAGADNFRLKVTNLEPLGGATANAYATFFVSE